MCLCVCLVVCTSGHGVLCCVWLILPLESRGEKEAKGLAQDCLDHPTESCARTRAPEGGSGVVGVLLPASS